jgi:hypothetical protein
VFWLDAPPGDPLAVATLDEARAAGVIAIREREQATVPEPIHEGRVIHVAIL